MKCQKKYVEYIPLRNVFYPNPDYIKYLPIDFGVYKPFGLDHTSAFATYISHEICFTSRAIQKNEERNHNDGYV